MFRIFVALFLSCSASALCHAASGDFKTDRPSPLKLLHPRKTEAVAFNFSGRIQLSGHFLVAWREGKEGRQTLHAVFFPDADSAARLPRMTTDVPVKELRLSNPEQAVAILLDPSSARRLLAKELLSATGDATATIRDYTISVACDRRWYEAKLVTASRVQKIAAGGREQSPYGCG